MNVAPEPPVDLTRLVQTQEQLRQLVDEVADLAAGELGPAEFFREWLRRILAALAAPAGTVWARTTDGTFLQQCHLDDGSTDSAATPPSDCDAVLRQVLTQARPVCLDGSAISPAASGSVLFAPLLVRRQVEAVVEVWLGVRQPQALPGILQMLGRLTDLAAVFLLRQRQPALQRGEELWGQIDAFTQRIHGSLHPTEVAVRVANEGRQLVGCDRLSVAVHHDGRVRVDAVSGVETVNARANLITHMRQLCQSVLAWGETLVYRGEADPSLPPAVVRDLDRFLERSHSKVVIVLPCRDPRDGVGGLPSSALVLECYALATSPDVMAARLAVLAPHATPALYNALAYRHIPLRFLWQPVARVQAGLGGKTKALLAGAAAALVALVLLLMFVPYPLKLDARGQLLPEQRRWVYAPVEGQVIRFEEGVRPGGQVVENQSLVMLHDVQLETRLVQLTQEVRAAQQDAEALGKQMAAAGNEKERLALSADKQQKEVLRDRKFRELRALRERTNADDARPGCFWLKAPLSGTILNWEFRETLTNRLVKPSDPLLRIGDKARRWEVELKIPQQHLGQIVQAFQRQGPGAELDVDLLLVSAPTHTYRGKLARGKLGGEAAPNPHEPTAAEAVVFASIRLDGPDIAPADTIPPELLITGTEVHAKVRCGKHAMGYALFYGLWEFCYEKIIFFF